MLCERGNYQTSSAAYGAGVRTQRRGAKGKRNPRRASLEPYHLIPGAGHCSKHKSAPGSTSSFNDNLNKDFWAPECAKCYVGQWGSHVVFGLLLSNSLFLLIITTWSSFKEPLPPSLLNPRGLESLHPPLRGQRMCLRAGQSPHWIPQLVIDSEMAESLGFLQSE